MTGTLSKSAQWYLANKERAKALMAARYRANRAAVIAKAAAWQSAHPERTRNSQRAAYARWRARNIEAARARGRISGAKRRAAHPEYQKAWRAANREAIAAYNKAWNEKNRERRRDLSAAGYAVRKARIRGNGPSERITPKQVYLRDEGVCQLCRQPVSCGERDEMGRRTWHIDHVIPISKGGAHAWANVQLAHRQCNLRKGARHQTGGVIVCYEEVSRG